MSKYLIQTLNYVGVGQCETNDFLYDKIERALKDYKRFKENNYDLVSFYVEIEEPQEKGNKIKDFSNKVNEIIEEKNGRLDMVCRMFEETYHDALELREQRDELLSFVGSIYHRLDLKDSFEDENLLPEIADFYQKYNNKRKGDNIGNICPR